jgi:hypothetical protein
MTKNIKRPIQLSIYRPITTRLFPALRPVAKFLVLDWGIKPTPGMGLSFWPASLYPWRGGPVRQPYRVSYIPQSGTMNLTSADIAGCCRSSSSMISYCTVVYMYTLKMGAAFSSRTSTPPIYCAVHVPFSLCYRYWPYYFLCPYMYSTCTLQTLSRKINNE